MAFCWMYLQYLPIISWLPGFCGSSQRINTASLGGSFHSQVSDKYQALLAQRNTQQAGASGFMAKKSSSDEVWQAGLNSFQDIFRVFWGQLDFQGESRLFQS